MTFYRPLILALFTLLFISACSQPADLPGAGLEPQFGTAGYDKATHVSTNPLGDVFVSGVSNKSGYIRRYTRAGELKWERRLNPREYTSFTTSAADQQGNVFLAIEGCYTIWLEEDNSTVLCDTHLRKYNRSGKVLWHQVYADSLHQDVNIHGFATDKPGNLYVLGRGFAKGTDDYLRKYGPGGKVLWTKKLVGSARLEPFISEQGNIFIASTTWSSDHTGSTALELTLTKYSGAGRVLWQRIGLFDPSYTGAGLETLAIGPNEEIYGIHTRKANLYPSLLALTPDAQKRWEIALNVVSYHQSLSTDPAGNVYLAIDNKRGEGSFASDILVSRYTPEGKRVWLKQFGTAGVTNYPFDLAVHSKNEVYVVGMSEGRVNGENYGGFDAFIMRLDGQGKRVWSR